MNNENITRLAELIGVDVDIVNIGREGIGPDYIESMTITGEKKTDSDSNIAIHINKFDWGKADPKVHGVFVYEVPAAKNNEPGKVEKVDLPQEKQDQAIALSKELGLEAYSVLSGDLAHKLITELSKATDYKEESSLEVSDILFNPKKSNIVRISISSSNKKLKNSQESLMTAFIDSRSHEIEVIDFLSSVANYDKTPLASYCEKNSLNFDVIKESLVEIAKSSS